MSNTQKFLDAFQKAWKDTKGATRQLRTEVAVSPLSLTERYFYWKAVYEDGGVIGIKVPLPKLWLANTFSSLFITAFNALFAEQTIEEYPAPEGKAKPIFDKARDEALSKAQLLQQGGMALKYLFYILFTQDEEATRAAVEQVEQQSNLALLFELIPSARVDKEVKQQLTALKLEYADALLNLVPLALDLYLYVNQIKHTRVAVISEEGTKAKAEALAGWL